MLDYLTQPLGQAQFYFNFMCHALCKPKWGFSLSLETEKCVDGEGSRWDQWEGKGGEEVAETVIVMQINEK